MVHECAPEQPTDEMIFTGESWSEAIVALYYCSPIAIAHALGQLQGGRRVWTPWRLEQAAGPTAGQTTIQSGVLCEQSPEAKINEVENR